MTDLLAIPAFLRRPLPADWTIDTLRAGTKDPRAAKRRYKMPSGKPKAKPVSRFHAAAAKERAMIEGRNDEVIGDFGKVAK
jgi:hypothetical protein